MRYRRRLSLSFRKGRWPVQTPIKNIYIHKHTHTDAEKERDVSYNASVHIGRHKNVHSKLLVFIHMQINFQSIAMLFPASINTESLKLYLIKL